MYLLAISVRELPKRGGGCACLKVKPCLIVKLIDIFFLLKTCLFNDSEGGFHTQLLTQIAYIKKVNSIY